MDSLKKLLTVLVAFCVVVLFTMPSFAAGPPSAKQELRKVNPRRYNYLFSVVGGAALGAGVGAMLGGGGAGLAKGALIGGGGVSELYLASYPNFASGYRSWGYILSNTALGAGLGWTMCGCGNGLGAGALIGGGGTAALEAWHVKQHTTTASANPRP